ncbi:MULTISPECIES: lipocalin family protein [unclassified Cellulophaga]|uniref:lipocalin family protein n=1 Tax=unclassified Cellulophaga TaxID=2634405 RepID=UPI0026E3632E|nr:MULTISPECIES: lipocalin family protein [unclassified Cellulophaga]MDO6490253.1 lipocalin family protein [Cellulophaga sp. 2_MG-2023]MDO6494553.1 lipocalin family protein [Cellulophaga sp. 3_MG-2023]
MIKKSFIVMAAVCMFGSSCSTDSDKEIFSENSLVGTWVISDFTREESSEVSLPQEIAKNLIDQGCKIITYTFNADDTFVGKDKLNYFVIESNGAGIEVDCPEETDTLVGAWDLDGDQLTITDPTGGKTVITVDLNGNTLIIAGEDIDEGNYEGLDVVFTKN